MNQNSYCHIFGNTDVGCKRRVNEDYYASFECGNDVVAVVCDGMGGHVGGERASHLAVDTIRNFLESNHFDDPFTAIIEACNAANQAILNDTRLHPELTGMGTTCVMLIVRNGKVYIGWIGDSRIYLVREKTITLLTKDQSYVQMLVDAGQITEEEAEHHPRKNEITNALGLPTMQAATVLSHPIDPQAGDCFILCSDGLSGMVSKKDILKIASNQVNMSQSRRVNTLIDMAKTNGGLDNITCVMVEFSLTPNEIPKPNKWIKTAIISLISIVVLILGILLIYHYCSKNKIDKENPSPIEIVKPTITKTFEIAIPFQKGGEVMSIAYNNESKTFDINVKGIDKDTLVQIDKEAQIDSISFTPKDNLDIIKYSDGGIKAMFNDKPFENYRLGLVINTLDTCYRYIFSVVVPVSDEEKVEGDATQKNYIGKVVTFDRTNTDHGDSIEGIASSTSTVSGIDAPSQNLDSTIDVPRDTSEWKVTLTGTAGQNTNNDIYVVGYRIGQQIAASTWYKVISNNGYKCKINIIVNKIPNTNAIIKIPLSYNENGIEMKTEYKIRINKR